MVHLLVFESVMVQVLVLESVREKTSCNYGASILVQSEDSHFQRLVLILSALSILEYHIIVLILPLYGLLCCSHAVETLRQVMHNIETDDQRYHLVHRNIWY